MSDRGGTPQIYRMSPDGGNAERVTFEGSYNANPRVAADGKSMVFVRRDGGRECWRCRISPRARFNC